jgi:hypothetical protein
VFGLRVLGLAAHDSLALSIQTPQLITGVRPGQASHADGLRRAVIGMLDICDRGIVQIP